MQKQPFADVIQIGVLINFAIFAKKRLWWILFLINISIRTPILKSICERQYLKFNKSVFWSSNIIILNLLWKTCTRTYTIVTRLKNDKAYIRLPVLRMISCDISNNESLGARNEKLVHEAGHVGWTKYTAC